MASRLGFKQFIGVLTNAAPLTVPVYNAEFVSVQYQITAVTTSNTILVSYSLDGSNYFPMPTSASGIYYPLVNVTAASTAAMASPAPFPTSASPIMNFPVSFHSLMFAVGTTANATTATIIVTMR